MFPLSPCSRWFFASFTYLTASCCLLSACGPGGATPSDTTGGSAATPADDPTMTASGGSTSAPGGTSAGSGGAIGATGGSSSTGGQMGNNEGPLVFGYVYELAEQGGPSVVTQLPYENVDYVVHAFVTADGSGNVVGVDNFDDHRTAGLVEQAHAAGKKVVLSLGGAGSTLQMAQLIGTSAQDTFVSNVVARINEWGYDGVDFDFEFPGEHSTPAEFTGFLGKLHTAVKANNPDHLVMFGISPGWWLAHYEWSDLGAVSDYGFYFCYDWNNPERGPMTKPPGTPLWSMEGGDQIEPSCRGVLDYITGKGYPNEKLIVGLPFAANGGAAYHTASESVKNGTPDPYTMEVHDGSGGYWPNVEGVGMKASAVLDPKKSVLSGNGTVAGVGFWRWGQENVLEGADLSSALRQRVDEL